MSDLIFVAIPTKGCVRNGAITEETLKFVADLHRVNPDKVFLCPMIQDYALLKYLPEMDATWEVWGAHCSRLIRSCDEVWVAKFDGYDTSTGVQAEIRLASELQKPVLYLSP